jgi:polysaccharide pyruvyl transferase WcaK-like protein
VPHVINSTEDAEDDYSLCKNTADEIRKYYPHIYTFEEKYKEDQIKAIIGKCDFFIGSRMHACIGAISMGVPTVPVAYSRKFIGIWDIYGMKDCIADAQTMDINEIMSKIDHCYNNRNKIKDVINIKLKNVKEEINSTLELIMSC